MKSQHSIQAVPFTTENSVRTDSIVCFHKFTEERVGVESFSWQPAKRTTELSKDTEIPFQGGESWSDLTWSLIEKTRGILRDMGQSRQLMRQVRIAEHQYMVLFGSSIGP